MVDSELVRRVARTSGAGPGDHVLEIGAGLGSLTLALAETGARVLALEIDERCVTALRHVMANTRVEVVEADARTVDYDELLRGAARWLLVANLPYNIATPLVLDLLSGVEAIESMIVMVQREAGERLAAPPGSRARGIPSVLVERHGRAEVVAEVGPEVFWPVPEVDSVVVRIDRHPPGGALDLSADTEARFELLLRTAFGQRRKMLRRSLAPLLTPNQLRDAGIDPSSRPESVSLTQWLALAAATRPA